MAMVPRNVHLSPMGFYGTHLRAISHEVLKNSIQWMSSKIKLVKLLPNFLGANKLTLVVSTVPADGLAPLGDD